MDPDSGKIYRVDDVPNNLIEVFEAQMTARQKAEMQVSPFDNRSELGQIFTGNRKERRRQAAIARRNKRKSQSGPTLVVSDAASPPTGGEQTRTSGEAGEGSAPHPPRA